MGFRVNVRSDMKQLEKKVGKENFKRGRYIAANQALLEMDKYVPKKHGYLRGSAHASAESVEYSGLPYARAQYYGSAYNKKSTFYFHKYTTAGTGKEWDKKLTSGQLQKIGKAALKGMGM